MKILAINSSARVGSVSKTELFLDLLVKGMREAGGEVEVINLKKKTIKPCKGCFTCWSKTPGECVFKDDMSREIFPRFLACDLLVVASPLFHYTVNAEMKAFIDRTIPNSEPYIRYENGVSSHPTRSEHPRAAVLSVAGFQEELVFDQLSDYVQKLYGDNLVAEIYRTTSEIFFGPRPGRSVRKIYAATVQAGRELVENLSVSDQTLAAIKSPIVDNENFAPVTNMTWDTCIEEGLTMGDFQKRNMIPRPQSIEMFLSLMKISLNRDKVNGIDMALQFEFSDLPEGNCFISINEQGHRFETGKLENPGLVIKTPFDTWMDITTQKANGQELFMEGKYTIEGDAEHLMKMGEIFG